VAAHVNPVRPPGEASSRRDKTKRSADSRCSTTAQLLTVEVTGAAHREVADFEDNGEAHRIAGLRVPPTVASLNPEEPSGRVDCRSRAPTLARVRPPSRTRPGDARRGAAGSCPRAGTELRRSPTRDGRASQAPHPAKPQRRVGATARERNQPEVTSFWSQVRGHYDAGLWDIGGWW